MENDSKRKAKEISGDAENIKSISKCVPLALTRLVAFPTQKESENIFTIK